MAFVSDVIAFARTNLKVSSDGISDADGITWTNAAMMDLRKELILRDVYTGQVQEAYRSLSAGVGEYKYPDDMFALKNLEINLIDTTSQNFVQPTRIDASQVTSYDQLRLYQDQQFPLFEHRGNSYEIFPTPTSKMNVTNAVRIFYYLQPTLYTSTSDTIVYPDSLDYRILSRFVQYYYFMSILRYDDAKLVRDLAMNDLVREADLLSRGGDMPDVPQQLTLTGYEF